MRQCAAHAETPTRTGEPWHGVRPLPGSARPCATAPRRVPAACSAPADFPLIPRTAPARIQPGCHIRHLNYHPVAVDRRVLHEAGSRGRSTFPASACFPVRTRAQGAAGFTLSVPPAPNRAGRSARACGQCPPRSGQWGAVGRPWPNGATPRHGSSVPWRPPTAGERPATSPTCSYLPYRRVLCGVYGICLNLLLLSRKPAQRKLVDAAFGRNTSTRHSGRAVAAIRPRRPVSWGRSHATGPGGAKSVETAVLRSVASDGCKVHGLPASTLTDAPGGDAGQGRARKQHERGGNVGTTPPASPAPCPQAGPDRSIALGLGWIGSAGELGRIATSEGDGHVHVLEHVGRSFRSMPTTHSGAAGWPGVFGIRAKEDRARRYRRRPPVAPHVRSSRIRRTDALSWPDDRLYGFV